MDRDYLNEIWKENRKTVIGLLLIIILLTVVFVVTLKTKDSVIMTDQDAVIERLNEDEVEEALTSELDINQYLDVLHGKIKEKYGDMLEGYEIAEGKLLDDGTWYVTTIEKPLVDQWSLPSDKYRIILHKNGDSWQIVAEPNLIFAYSDYPDIPEGVIKSANNL